VRIAKLDPTGGQNIPGYDSYIALMKSNLDVLTKELNP
jgi:hypothetical protein